jgi:hypothetical protein
VVERKTTKRKTSRRRKKTPTIEEKMIAEASGAALKMSELVALCASAPQEVAAALDDGAVAGKIGEYSIVHKGGKILWPTGTALARVSRRFESPTAVRQSEKAAWTTAMPADPGFFWFYGTRHWDDSGAPPQFHLVRSELYVERQADGTMQDRLVTMSDGKAMAPRWPHRGVFTPLFEPESPAADFAVSEAVPMGPPSAEQIHAVHAGRVLCGFDVNQLKGRPVARGGQLGIITCPNCRAAAERVG